MKLETFRLTKSKKIQSGQPRGVKSEDVGMPHVIKLETFRLTKSKKIQSGQPRGVKSEDVGMPHVIPFLVADMTMFVPLSSFFSHISLTLHQKWQLCIRWWLQKGG